MADKKKKRGSILYLTKEGFRNVWSNSLMSLASISVLLSCLVMIGVAFMALVNMEEIISDIEDQNVIMVFVDDNANRTETDKVGTDLRAVLNVKDCVFVPKEESFREQIANLDAEAELFNGIENPLPDAYKVTLSDLEYFDDTVNEIKQIDNVLNVRENRDLANQLTSIRKTVTYVSLGAIIVLLIVSLFIISNTVRITMFSRRLEIKIMKSVGATSWFIRWPFMVEGMVLGVISAIFSLGFVWGIYYLVERSLKSMLSLLLKNGFVAFGEYALYLLAAFLIIGVFAGAFGSAISINKYLKEQEYDTDEE